MAQGGSYDLIVVGAGPGGYVCAIRAAQLGMKVACVESREALGGTCLNVGCIPSKALLESSHHYHNLAHNFADHGIHAEKIRFDLGEMLKRKDQVVDTITKGVDYLFSKNKVTWLKGWGTLSAKNQVTVRSASGENSSYEARHVVVATGSAPIDLPIAPFDHKDIIDSTDALSLPTVPKHLVVIGAGVIGLEMGSVWSRLGAQVTFVEALPHILSNTDRGISQAMQKIMEKQGMKFHLKTSLVKAEVESPGQVKVTCQQGQENLFLEADKVLVAVGRRPFTKDLGLEALGIKTDRSFITVDHRWQTNVEGVYAIGDVTPGPMLAHKAEEEGVACAEVLAGQKGHVNYGAIPNVVYTWPEVATIGLSEEECKEQNLQVKVGKFHYKANGRARAMNETDGLVKIIADKKTDKLLGFHIVGASAGEMIAEAAIAFEYGASSEDIARSVHAHPTLAEIMKEAALDVDNRALHS